MKVALRSLQNGRIESWKAMDIIRLIEYNNNTIVNWFTFEYTKPTLLSHQPNRGIQTRVSLTLLSQVNYYA